MTTPRSALAAIGLALALAACSPKPAVNGTASSAGGPMTAISAAELPRVKAGYWRRVDTTNGGAPTTTHICDTGEPVDLTPVTRNCSAFSIKRTFAGGLVTDAACASGPVSSTVHMTISGDFGAAYASDGQMTVTLKGRPPQTFTLHSVSTYLGPCPAREGGG